ncbi:MAG: VanZ family protein [Piscinibacter sp.]|nr:VanZ family protein [Piscinibacter sp.]
MVGHRSSAVPLAWLYAALIGYASLYPFSGWRDSSAPLLQFLVAPPSRYWSGFDLVANLLGYMPLGALLFGAQVRRGAAQARAAWTTLAAGCVLSLAMELLQNFLPRRVPSNVDLALNTLGTAAGVAIGALVHRLGGVERWQAVRDRWFIGRSAGGLALLLLWPIGLLFPAPLPLGLGQVLVRAQEGARELLEGSSVLPLVEPWLSAEPRLGPPSPGTELVIVALGLLAPCMVAFTVARPGWRRLLLVGGATALGWAATTLSTALNFGPDHALAWRTANAGAGFALGALLALLLVPLPRRMVAGVGLVALTALVLLVVQVPADPYFAESLLAWEQGRFIRFHGAAQWVGWLWPYAAMVYLLVRVGARADEPAAPRT